MSLEKYIRESWASYNKRYLRYRPFSYASVWTNNCARICVKIKDIVNIGMNKYLNYIRGTLYTIVEYAKYWQRFVWILVFNTCMPKGSISYILPRFNTYTLLKSLIWALIQCPEIPSILKQRTRSHSLLYGLTRLLSPFIKASLPGNHIAVPCRVGLVFRLSTVQYIFLRDECLHVRAPHEVFSPLKSKI